MDPGFASAIGWKVYEARTAASLTQFGLADAASLSRGTIARIELGTMVPRICTFMKLSRALGVSVLDLIPDEFPDDFMKVG